MNKGNIIDRIFTIIGLVLAIISTFNLIGVFQNEWNWSKILSFISLVLGISIVALLFYKKRNETTIKKIGKNKLFDEINQEIKIFNTNSKAIFLNPNKQFNQFNSLLNILIEKDINVSIVGESSNLISLLSIIDNQNYIFFNGNSYVANNIQDSFVFILIKNDYRKMSVFLESEKYNYILEVSNNKLIHTIAETILKINRINDLGIELKNTNKPIQFLKLIQKQKQKFEINFNSLKSGHISFYGTEVQKTQINWLTDGGFELIRTLDLTSNPALLLTRENYIKANEQFVNNGGKIQRVFIISKENLNDKLFMSNLKLAVNLQKEIGITIKLSILENLTPNQKQDFILYDNYGVLVEEKQANSDYSFGKSSAYFNKNIINEYETIFNEVWQNHTETIETILKSIDK